MKTKLFIIAIACLSLFLLAFPQTTSAQNRSAYEIIQDTNNDNHNLPAHAGGSGGVGAPAYGVIIPPAGPDNPPDFRDPTDPRKILDYSCTGRQKTTIPGTFRWSCTSRMSCTCTMTYRDDNGRVQTCAASPMSRSLTGSGGDSDRNACITEADGDLDSERDSFFAECQAALANCPP